MSQLFRRAARIQVDTIVLEGLRASFKITKTLRPSPNTCELRIYNLSPTNRNQIEQMAEVTVKIDAGYAGNLSTLFLGDLGRGRSAVDGTSIVTTLEGRDGGRRVRTARVARSFAAGTSVEAVLTQVASALGLDPGNSTTAFRGARLGSVQVFAEGTAVDGSAADVLTSLTAAAGLEWSAQGGAIQVLPRGQALNLSAVVLSPDTGLVGSPSIDTKGVVKAKALLIPELTQPGRKVQINSRFVSGIYRVDKVEITGDTEGKDWHCSIEARA